MGNEQTTQSTSESPEDRVDGMKQFSSPGNEQTTESTSESPEDRVDGMKQWTKSDIEAYVRQTAGALVVIIHNKVYDLTRFKDEHPGGVDVLEEVHLSDGSNAFDEIGHSPDAIEMMNDYLLGGFQG